MKSEALKQFEQEAHQKKREQYPGVPEHAIPKVKLSDATANGLTKCIVDYLKVNGHKVWRQSSEGRYRPGKQYVDAIGRTRIMKGSYLPGTNKGHGDVSAIIRGQFVAWEVKMKDTQSQGQKQFQKEVEASGGKYFIAHSFDEFITQYRTVKII